MPKYYFVDKSLDTTPRVVVEKHNCSVGGLVSTKQQTMLLVWTTNRWQICPYIQIYWMCKETLLLLFHVFQMDIVCVPRYSSIALLTIALEATWCISHEFSHVIWMKFIFVSWNNLFGKPCKLMVKNLRVMG
jgi:hypothetical protein